MCEFGIDENIEFAIKNGEDMMEYYDSVDVIKGLLEDKISENLEVPEFKRELYYIIDSMIKADVFEAIGIKGTRGVGKTTIMKQLCMNSKNACYLDMTVLKGVRFNVGAAVAAITQLVKKYNFELICIDELNILDSFVKESRRVIEALQSMHKQVVITASSSIFMDMLEKDCSVIRLNLITLGEMSFQEYLRFNGYNWNRYRVGSDVRGLSEYRHDYNDLYIEYALGYKYPTKNAESKLVKYNYNDTIASNIYNILNINMQYSSEYVYDDLKEIGYSDLLSYMTQIILMLAYKGIDKYAMSRISLRERYNYARESKGIAINKLSNPGVHKMSEIDKRIFGYKNRGKQISIEEAAKIVTMAIAERSDQLEVNKSVGIMAEKTLKLVLAMLYDMGLVFLEYKTADTNMIVEWPQVVALLEKMKNNKITYEEIDKHWNFVLFNTSLYWYIIDDCLKVIGEKNDARSICKGLLRGMVVETSLKSDYVKYMRYPVVVKYNAIEKTHANDSAAAREIERLRRNIASIQRTSTTGKKDISEESAKNIQLRIKDLENKIDEFKNPDISKRPIVEMPIEVDMINNFEGDFSKKLACEISTRDKNDDEVNLELFSDSIKILTTNGVDDTLNKDFDINKIVRIPFGKAGLYFGANALARLAVNENLFNWVQ